jgi:hypothetical protein
MLTDAEADAQVLTARVLDRLNQGIMERSKIGALFFAASNSALEMHTDPMEILFRAIADRTAEYSERLQNQIPGWADDTASQLKADGLRFTLASQLSSAKLQCELNARIAELHSAIKTSQASAAALEADLRRTSDRIANSMAPPLELEQKEKLFLESRWGGFLVPVLLSSIIAGLLLVFGGAQFFPGPAAVLAGGVLWALFGNLKQNQDERKQLEHAPFRRMKRQVETYCAQNAETLEYQRRLWHAEGLLQRLESERNSSLPSAYQNVCNIAAQWQREIPAGVFVGESADCVYISGREIVEVLWSFRRSSWSMPRFLEQLIQFSGKPTIEELMSKSGAEEVAVLMRNAATAILKPVTLTEVVLLLMNSIPGGKERLIGELAAHGKLLASLFPIQSHVACSPDPACPTVFHFCLPPDLMTALRPVLEQAVPRRSFDIYPGNEDEIKCVFESFNWTSSERARFDVAQHAYVSYLPVAIEERWSAITLLDDPSSKHLTAVRLIN